MTARHVLVTNDFPPKVGGIQSYLWELWRRLRPGSFAVYTTPWDGAVTFDATQPFPVERSPEPVIGPYPWLVSRIDAFAARHDADLVILDPAVPLGALGPWLQRPYAVVVHGAEVTVPGRLPGTRAILGRTLRRADLVIAAGRYPLVEAERCAGRALPAVVVPPGVDGRRFRPFTDDERAGARRRFGWSDDEFVVATVNRLVPRKGIDVLIEAAALLTDRDGPPVRVAVGGAGRHRSALERLVARLEAPVDLLGRVGDDDVVGLYGAADAMAMLCHDRWWGLEQEGFGISFLEAAAAGLPQVAGRSGGAHEAVVDGVTGIVVDRPRHPAVVATVLDRLRRDRAWRVRLGHAARARAEHEFDYGRLAGRLQAAIDRTAARVGASGGDHRGGPGGGG